MSLRRLNLILIFLSALFLIGVILTIVTSTLQTHFENQEKLTVYGSIQRVLGQVNAEVNILKKTSKDWAFRDDSYNYVLNGDPAFVIDNLMLSTYQRLGVDLIVFVDRNSQVVFGKVWNRTGNSLDELPQTLQAVIKPQSTLLAGADQTDSKGGLIMVDGTPMLVVSGPILRSDASGPAGGSLLVGRYMDAEFINNINNLLLLSINASPISGKEKSPEYSTILSYRATPDAPYYVELSSSLASGYLIFNDYFGNPALLVRVDQFPTLLNSGYLVNNYLVISIVVSILLFGILLFALIEFNVVSRISHLGKNVLEIGASGDIKGRVQVKRKDEISRLAGAINNMLGALERAEVQRQESEQRFSTLVESMDDVVFTMDETTRQPLLFPKKQVSAAPGTAVRKEGISALLKQVLEEQLGTHQELLDRSFQGESSEFEWAFRSEDTSFDFITTISPIYNLAGKITSVVGVSKDISSQKRLENDLRRRVAELDALYHVSQELLIKVESQSTQQTICRLAIEQLKMEGAWLYVPTPNGAGLQATAAHGADLSLAPQIPLLSSEPGPHPIADTFNDLETRLLPVDQAGFPPAQGEMDRNPAVVILPLTQGQRAAAILVLSYRGEEEFPHDLLPLVQAFGYLSSVAYQNAYLFGMVKNGRERMQALSRRLVEVQEEERRRIALELHDEIGQVLTGLRLAVEMIPRLPPEKLNAQISSTTEIVNDLIGRVRQLSLDLRPSMLDDLGIIPTLVWFFERYSGQTGIQVEFQHASLAGRRFTPDIEITIYRVVQEALTNVARHARVTTVHVTLWCNEQVLGVQVEDQGVGFKTEEVVGTRNSRGLVGIGERISCLRGQLNIVSQPGEGTSLSAEIPLKGELERRKNAR